MIQQVSPGEIANHVTIQYLLSFIDNLPGSSASNGCTSSFGSSDRHGASTNKELRQLLTEAKEGLVSLNIVYIDSRTGSNPVYSSVQETKNTTNEFFETLERITNELRGMTVRSSGVRAIEDCF